VRAAWDPDKHKDRYRARLKRVVDRKRKGETIKTPKASEEPETPAALMAALERTLEELQSGNGRRR
jgi:non-homologous end joining protein Ku